MESRAPPTGAWPAERAVEGDLTLDARWSFLSVAAQCSDCTSGQLGYFLVTSTAR